MIKYVVALLAVLPAAVSCSGTLPHPGDPGRSHDKLPTEAEWITQVLGSTDPDVDLIEAGTVIASGFTGAQRPYSTIPNVLEVPIRKARDRIGQASSAEQKIEALNELVLPAIHAALGAELSWLRDAFAVDDGRCIVTTLLYLIAADALSLPLELVCPPGHAYLRYSREGQRRYIETTSAGQHLTEAQYLEHIGKSAGLETPLPEQGKDTEWYFATKSRRQFVALLFLNRGLNRGAESREKDYLNASRIAPDLPWVFRQLTSFHKNAGNLELAEEFATRAVGLAGPWPKIHLLRGRIRSLRGNLKGSLEDVEAAIQYAPHRAFLHHTRAALLRQLDRSREAVDACNRSLELDPGQTGARRERAYLYLTALKDYARAIEDLSEIIGKGHPGASDFHNRGICQTELKRHGQALEDFNRAIDLEPGHVDARRHRAYLYQTALKDYPRAIADLSEVILKGNPSPSDFQSRGRCLAQAGELQKGLEDLTRAVQASPKNPSFLTDRGVCLRLMKLHAEAIEDFTRALELDPANSDARRERAWLYLTALKDYARAAKELSEIIVNGKPITLDFQHRGSCLEKMKRYAEAIEDFSRAIALEPKNAALYTLRSKTYALLEDEARWEADFNKAKELRGKP